jgi:methyl-accepting chemotaxis protein
VSTEVPDDAGERGAGARAGAAADQAHQIDAMAARLRELAERLRDPEVGDQPAAELAREAAELVSRAGNELDRALREADSGPERLA